MLIAFVLFKMHKKLFGICYYFPKLTNGSILTGEIGAKSAMGTDFRSGANFMEPIQQTFLA
jgi:hypothetical protein